MEVHPGGDAWIYCAVVAPVPRCTVHTQLSQSGTLRADPAPYIYIHMLLSQCQRSGRHGDAQTGALGYALRLVHSYLQYSTEQ